MFKGRDYSSGVEKWRTDARRIEKLNVKLISLRLTHSNGKIFTCQQGNVQYGRKKWELRGRKCAGYECVGALEEGFGCGCLKVREWPCLCKWEGERERKEWVVRDKNGKYKSEERSSSKPHLGNNFKLLVVGLWRRDHDEVRVSYPGLLPPLDWNCFGSGELQSGFLW